MFIQLSLLFSFFCRSEIWIWTSKGSAVVPVLGCSLADTQDSKFKHKKTLVKKVAKVWTQRAIWTKKEKDCEYEQQKPKLEQKRSQIQIKQNDSEQKN